MRIRALLLLAIAAGVHAGPIVFEDNSCSTTCVPTVKFGYEQGSTYRFQYEADTVTSLAGATEEQSVLHIRSVADVSVMGPCEMLLHLRDVSLEEGIHGDLSSLQTSPNSAAFSAALERNPLRFSFQDGRVESVCASEDEPVWVVNFKRGVLSAFQNSMESFDSSDEQVTEIDISGQCEAEYEISSRNEQSVTITKSKNLLGCTERTNYFTSLQSTPYTVPSDVQSLPLLKSTHECKQEITKSGILSRSDCTESHMFRPFSNHDNGAVTTVKQSLVHLREVSTPSSRGAESLTKRTSLVFVHEPRPAGETSDTAPVMSIMKEICSAPDIRPDTPRHFSALVYAMRRLDVNALQQAHRAVEFNTVCSMAKKFFHDAIPALGTASSVAMISELTSSGEVTGPEADLWITSLAFVQEPTAEMITQTKALLTVNRKPQAYLAISSLVHSYCKSADCQRNTDVQDIINTFTQNLGYNCKVSKSEEYKVLMSVKALGNLGLSTDTVSVLARCAANGDACTAVRLAAIEAYRRLPCTHDRESLMSLLLNTEEETEIRIAAYLAVMQCPTQVTLTQVKHVLENEEINQVGSFIWTHLTNLMETNDIFKKDIRTIVEDEILAKEFNLDARKFSRNYEGSFFWESINSGAKYESNVIFSPSSFLPRSAMLNLTVDMFGQSVNLLEVGGRMQGMEQYLEKFFGPDGYFPQNTVSDLIKGKLQSADNQLRNKFKSDPEFSLYMKMFGNELSYLGMDSFGDMDTEMMNPLNILLKLAQNNEVELTKSSQFLDTEMTVPTAVGLPLSLAVNGTASIELKLSGKMDIRKLASWPSSFDIDGVIKPSGAVTFSSKMGVDAFMARSGMQMISTLHSSTEVNGKVSLEDGKVMSVNVNMPQEKIELLNAETKFFIIHREEEREQKMLADNVVEKTLCTGESFSTVTGVKICGDLSFPKTQQRDAPYFPLTGPASAHLSIEKADTHKSYVFEARVETEKERREGKLSLTRVARLAFNTPGSRVDREFVADYRLDQAARTLSAHLRTPWKEAIVAGSVINTPALKNANILMTVDGKYKYSAIAEVAMDRKGDTIIYSPNLQVSAPGMEAATLSGKAKITPMEKLDVDLSLNNVFSSPVTLSGGIDKTAPNRYTTDITLSSPVLNTQVSGFSVVKDGAMSTRTEFKYDYNNGPQHQFVLNGKYKDACTKYATKYSINTAIQTTEFPDYNMQLEGAFLLNRKQLETSMEFVYGDDPKDNYKRIVLQQSADFAGDELAVTLDHSLTAMWKAIGLNMNSKVTHSHKLDNPLHVNTQAVLSYSPGKEISLDMKLNSDSQDPLQATHDITLTIPGREMRLYQSLVESNEGSPRQYNMENIIQWQKARQVRTVTTYKVNGDQHEFRTEITRPSGAVTVLDGEGVMNFRDFSGSINLNHDGQAYSTGLEYNWQKNNNLLKVGGKVDLILPARHVSVASDLTIAPGNYISNLNVMWDVENDKSQKVMLGGRLQLDGGSHEGLAKVVYPGRKMTLTFTQKLSGNEIEHHSELSWAARQTIMVDINSKMSDNDANAMLKLATPFFRDVTIKGNGQRNNQELSGHFEVDYGRVISTDMSVKTLNGLSNMETSWTINTPFRGFETLTVATSHNLDPNMRNVHLEVARNSDKAEITGKMEKLNGKSQGLAEIIYPGQKVNLVYNCMITDSELTHHSELSWTGSKPISLDVEAKLTASSTDGKIKLSTPFTSNDFTVDVNAQKSRNTWTGHAEVDYGRKISSDVSVNIESPSKMENSVSINTPFSNWEKLSLIAKHDFEGEEKSAHLEVSRNNQKIELVANGNCDGQSSSGEIELRSPYTDPISIKFTKAMGDSQVVGNVEVKWQDKSMKMDVDGKYDGNTAEGNMALNTPFTQPMALRTRAGDNRAHIEIQWQNKQAQVDVMGKIEENAIEGSIEVNTPYAEQIAVRGSASLENGHAVSHAEMEWGRKKIEVDAEGKYQGPDMSASLQLKTPYMQPITVSGSANIQQNQVSTNVEFQWQNDKKIEISASGKYDVSYNARELEGKFALKTPFTSDILVEAKHQDNGKQFSCNMMAQWAPRKQIDAVITMNHNMNGYYFTNNGRIKITTPFRVASDLGLTWKQSFQGWNDITSNNELEYNGKTIAINYGHNIEINTNSHKVNTEASIRTPYDKVQNADVKLGYVLNNRELEGSASVNHNDVNYLSATADATFNRDDTSAEAKINSKILYAEDLSMTFSMKKTDSHNGLLEVKWAPNQAITIEAEYTPKEHGLSINSRLTTPFRQAERIIVSFDHDKQGDEWQTKGHVEYAAQKHISFETTLQIENGVSASIDLSSPCPYIRSLKSSFSQVGQGAEMRHTSALSYEMDNVKIDYSGELNVNGLSVINGKAELTTPFKYLRKHKISIDHKLQESNYASILTYDFNRENVHIENHFQNTNNRFMLSTELKTTFECVPSVKFEAEHNRENDISGKISYTSLIKNNPSELTVAYGKRDSEVFGEMKMNGILEMFISGDVEPISLRFNHNSPTRQYNTEIEIEGMNKKISFNNKVDMENGVKIDSSLTTPFKEFSTVSFKMNHLPRGSNINFDTSANLLITIQQGDIEIDTALDMDWYKLFNGHATLKTPFRNAEIFEVSVKHVLDFEEDRKGEFQDLKADQGISVQYAPNKKIELTRVIEMATKDNGNSKTIFTSPFRGWEIIEVDQSAKTSGDSGTYTVAVTYAPGKTVTTELMFNVADNKMHFQLDTPFREMSHLFWEGQFVGSSMTDFSTNFKGELTVNGVERTVSGASNFNLLTNEQKLNAGVTLQSNIRGFENIRISLSHVNNPNNNFVTAVTVDIPAKQISFNSNLKLTSFTEFSGEVTLVGPIDISLNFNHKGDYMKFGHGIQVSVGNKKTEYEGSFEAMFPIKGTFKLSSPYKMIRNKQVEFTIDGTPTDFTAVAEIMYAPNKKIETTGLFKLDSGLQAKFEASTPFSKDIKLNVDHQGTYNFDHTTTATYGKKTIQLKSNFKVSPDVEGKITLTTPFANLQSLDVNLKLSGNLGAFDSELGFNHNDKNTMSVKLDVDSSKYSANLEVESSFGKKFMFQLYKNTNLPEFSMNGKVRYGSKSIVLDSALELEPITGHFKLETPWQAVRDIDVSLNSQGSLNNFESTTSVSHNGEQKYTASMKFSNQDVMQGSFELKTPHECMRSVSAEFTHKLTKSVLQCHGNVAVNEVSYINGDVNFKLMPNIEGTVQLQTPFKPVEDLKMTVTYQGELSNFESMLKMENNEFGSAQVNANFNQNPLEGLLRIQTPSKYMQDASMKFGISVRMPECSSMLELEHNLMGKMGLQGKVTVGDVIEGEITLTTPYNVMKETSVTFRHEGGLMDFNSRLEFNHNKLGQAVFNADFKPWTGNLMFQSRCPYLRDIRVAFTHTGDLESFRCNGEVSYSGKTVKGNVGFDARPIKASVSVELPNQKTFSAEVNHRGSLRNFNSDLTLLANNKNMMSAELKADTRNTVKISSKFSSPFTKDYELVYNHDGNLERFTCHSEIKTNNRQVFNADLTFNLDPTKLTLDISTPYRQLRHLEITTQFEGSVDDFKTSLDVKHNDGDNYYMSASIKMTDSSITVDVETPISWMKHVQATATFAGELNDFTSSFDATHNDVNKYHFGTTMKVTPNDISIDVETPLPWMESLTATAAVAGSSSDFNSKIEIIHQKIKKYTVQTNFKLTRNLLKITIKTPFTWLKNFKLAGSLSGNPTDFQSSVEFTYNNAQTKKAALSFKLTQSEIAIELETPHAKVKTVSLTGTFQGVLTNFQASWDVSLNGGNPKHGEMAFKLTDNKLVLKIKTPRKELKTLEFTGTFSGNPYDFTASVDVVHNTDSYHADGLVKLTQSDIRIELKTPAPELQSLVVSGAWSGDLTDCRSNLDINHNGIDYNSEVAFKYGNNEVNVELKTPYPSLRSLEVGTKFEGEINDFRTSLEYSYNGGRNQLAELAVKMTETDVAIEMKTPSPALKKLDVFVSYSGQPTDFKSSWSAAYNGGKNYAGKLDFKMADGSINIDLMTPFPLLKHLEIENTYSGNYKNFQTNLAVVYNDAGRYVVDLAYDQRNPFKLNLDLRTPHAIAKHVKVDSVYTGRPRNFQSSITIAYNGGEEKTVALAYKQTRTAITIDLATPNPLMKTLQVDISFDGTKKDFTSNVGFTHNGGQRQTIDVTFKLARTEVTLDVRSTIESMQHISVTGTHTGNRRAFNTNLEISYNEDANAFADVEFKLSPLQGKIELRTPWEKLRGLSASFNHESDSEAVKANAELTLNDEKLFVSEMNLGFNPLAGSLSLSSPKFDTREVTASFSHSGTMKDFQNHAEVKFGDKKFTIDNTVSSQKIHSTVTTPIEKYETVGFTITKKGNLKTAFDIHAEATYEEEKTVELDVKFKFFKRLSLDTVFKSPFTKVASLSLKHEYDNNVLSEKLDVKYGQKQILKVEGELTVGMDSSGQVEIITPIEGFEKVTAAYKHQFTYTEDSVSSSGSASYNGEQVMEYNQVAHCTDLTNSGLKIELKTPFPDADYFMVSFKIEGTKRSFTEEMEIVLPKENKFTSKFTLQTTAGIKASLTTNMEGFEDISLDISHASTNKKLNLNGVLTRGSIELVSFEIDLKLQTQLFDGTVTFTSIIPHMKELSAETHLEGTFENFQSKHTISWKKGREATMNTMFTSSNGIPTMAKVTAKAPMFNPASAEFNNEYNDGNMKTSLLIKYGRNKAIDIKAEGALSGDITDLSFQGSVSMTTPFRKVSQFSIEGQHEHRWAMVESSLEVKHNDENVGSSRLSLNQNTGSVNVDGPFKVILNYNRDEEEGTFNMQQPAKVEASYQITPESFTFEMTKPRPMDLTVRYNRQGGSVNMRNPIEIDASYTLSNDQVSVNIIKPYEVEASVSQSANGGSLSIIKPYQVETSYTLRGDSFSYLMTKPLKIDLSATFRPEELLQFNINKPVKADFKAMMYDGGERVKFDMQRPVLVDGEITYTPQKVALKLLKPVMIDFEATLTEEVATFDMRKPVMVDARVEYTATSASLTMQKPVPVEAQVTFSQNSGTFTMTKPYKVDASLQYNRRGANFEMTKPIKVDAELKYDQNGGSFKMNNPYPVDATVRIAEDGGSFEMRAPIEADASYTMGETSGSFTMNKPYKVDARYTFTDNSGSFIMQSPIAIETRYTYGENGGEFNMVKPMKIDAKLELTDDSASFVMEKPYPVDVSVSVRSDGASINMKKPYSIDAEFTLNANGASIRMQSPYQINADYSMQNDGHAFTMRAPYQMDAKYAVSGHYGSINMENPYQVDAQYNLEGNAGAININRPYAVDAQYTVGQTEGSFSIKTPFELDLTYTLGTKQGKVEISKPAQMAAIYNIEGSRLSDISGDVKFIWDTNKRDKNVRVEFMHKDETTRYVLKEMGSVKMILPTRTVGVSSSIEKSATKLLHTSELIWDQGKDRKVSYSIDMNDRSNYIQSRMDLTAKLETPIRSLEVTANHNDNGKKYSSDATLRWDAARDQSKTVTLRNEYEHTATSRKSAIVIGSPLLSKDISLRNEYTVNEGNVLYTCRHELQYTDDARDTLTVTTRFADDGNTYRGNHNYTAAVAVVHPRSTVDISLTSHLALTDVLSSAAASVDYMMADRSVHTADIRAQINNIKKTMLMELNTPIKTASVSGKLVTTDSQYTYSLVGRDEDSQVDVTASVMPSDSTFSLEAHLNPRNPAETITVRGNYLSPTAMKIQALHGRDGDMTTDSEISIDLENRRLLKTNVHWRPAVWSDIKTAVNGMIENIDPSSMLSGYSVYRASYTDELQAKAAAIGESLPTFRPIRDLLSSEADSFAEDLRVTRKEFKRMYWKNEFFMKTIDTTIDAAVVRIAKVTGVVVAGISKVANVVYPHISAAYSWTVNYISDVMGECMETLSFAVQRFTPVVMKATKDMLYKSVQVTRYVAETIADVSIGVLRTMLSLGGSVLELVAPYIQTYMQVLETVSEWCEDACDYMLHTFDAVMATYPFNHLADWAEDISSILAQLTAYFGDIDYLTPINSAQSALTHHVNLMAQTMADHAAGLSDKYSSVIYTAHRVMGEHVQNYINMPPSEYARQWLANMQDQLRAAYDYIGAEDLVKNYLEKASGYVIDMLKSNALYIVNDYLHLDLTKVIVYDPSKGNFQLEVYIPDEMPSMQYVPFTQIEWSELWNRIKHVRDDFNAVNVMPEDANPWDYYYMYKPSPNVEDWIPPFKAIATVAGQHITTFDNKVYEFLGTCSYILSHDVMSNQFTIIKDYDKNVYRVFVDSKQVDINADGQVSVDSTNTELPVEFDSTAITRVGDVITLTSRRGFTVTLDLDNELFTLHVSGWFYNKLAGLTGTYTNEQSDDFIMANGKKTDDVDQMAESWQIGVCEGGHMNRASEYSYDESKPSVKMCKVIFGSSISPLRNCFKVVDPAPYLKACANDMEESSRDDGVCKTAAAYAAHCKQQHVPVRLPRPCRKCKEQVQGTNPNSADVLFVIEQKQCNNDMVSRIDNLAMMTDRALNDKGLSGNRFGLIGFGGRGVHNEPHTHTLGGKVLGISREMKPAAESLVFVEDGDFNDAVSALKMATQYPFRAAVAKVVILISCGPCQEGSTPVSQVQAEMMTAGIQLHVLVEHEFQLISPEASVPKTSYLYGIDTEVVYTKNDVRDKDLSGNSDLAAQIAPPSDKCANLALNTKGSFFNLQKLKEGRVRFQKHFMDVFSRRVAKTAESQDCSVCECNEEGVSVCRPCQDTPLLGRPDEEPAQFYDQNFDKDLQTYMKAE